MKLTPGVLSNWPVNVLTNVFFFGQFRSFSFDVAGYVLPVAVAIPDMKTN
jgi:hypothetical protein